MNSMRTRAGLFMVLALTMTLSLAAQAADTYKIDPAHSHADFKIGHMGVSTVSGRFNGLSGTVTLDAKDDTKDGVDVEIKTTSIDTGNEGRDKHLRTADFFDVEKFPTMTFKGTSFKKKEGSKYDVTGDFTLHGVKKSITVVVEQIGAGKNQRGVEIAGFETSFTIKRSDYGMSKMVGPVGDEVKISFAVECAKQ